MEIRKVQKTGGSTFIVSLPKGWISKHKIKEKDPVGIISQPDGNLLIIPKIESDDIVREIEIDADELNDVNFIFRALIGAYIKGYSTITVKSSTRFDPNIRDCISTFTRNAIGPEIFEETNNIIIIKDTLNPKEMPFENSIRRMYILANDMHKVALNALTSGDKSLAEEVIKKDDEIDRLHWLIGRQSHIVLRDIILSQKMGITLEDAFHYHQISRFLERIGDHAVKIAKNVLMILDQNIDEEIIQKLLKASKFSMKLLDNSMDAWRLKNITEANKNIELVSDLIKQCEDLTLNPKQEKIENFVGIGYIVESIRRTGEYAGDISEVIINNLIG